MKYKFTQQAVSSWKLFPYLAEQAKNIAFYIFLDDKFIIGY